MIDVLTIPQFGSFSLDVPTKSTKHGGGGMATKMARIQKILDLNFPGGQVISNMNNIDSNNLIVDMSWFEAAVQSGDWFHVKEKFKELNLRKVLAMCSEKAILRISHTNLREVCSVVDGFTSNCKFLSKMFPTEITGVPATLTDPIPDSFFENVDYEKRDLDVVAMGHVSWFKNSHNVSSVFEELQSRGIKTAYIGSAGLWKGDKLEGVKIQESIYSNCDFVIEDATEAQVVKTLKRCKAGLWYTVHDTFATACHEMLSAGLPVVASNHGLADELPVRVMEGFKSVCDEVEKIVLYEKSDWDYYSRESQSYAYKSCSEKTFIEQLKTVLA